MGHDPVGCRFELREVGAFLERVELGLAGFTLTGPAGIGKTTLWREGVRMGEAQGFGVLSARPSGSETRLSFAGLSDLLSPVDEAVFDRLPPVQRHALDVALLRTDPGSSRRAGRAVAAAVLSLLRELARAAPVLIAVDDAQWLDVATADALAFALRRLDGSPVGVLASVRVDGERPATFERSLPVEQRVDVALSPLSLAAIHDIVKAELGGVLPRPTVVRIVAASGGNPFYAVEIARELMRLGETAPSRNLPVPEGLRMLVHARLRRLPRRTKDTLLVAACLASPTTALVDVEALAPAEEAGVVRIEEDGLIRFTHPLLASAVYESAPTARRGAVHRDLAARIDDPEERARHLALGAGGPDEEIARELDAAADHAAARGASAEAAELSRLAFELSGENGVESRVRRSLALAGHLIDTGETSEAHGVLEGSLAHCPAGELLAALLLQLGVVCWYERDFEQGYAYLQAALPQTDDPKLAARIHIQAAWLSDRDPLRAIRHDDAVLQLLDAADSPGIYSNALLHGAYLRLISGQGADDAAFERGRELQAGAARDDSSPVLTIWPKFKDDFSVAREHYESGLELADGVGDETAIQSILCHLAELDCWTGDWERADRRAAEGLELAERVSSAAFLGSALYARGYVDAHLGRVADARSAGERILELLPDDPQAALGHWVLGFLALSLADYTEAASQLTRAGELLDARGQREPARERFHPDQVEAVIALGQLERAEVLLDRLAERARVFPRPWILATTARCAGLLHAARGDLDAALAVLAEALDHHERLEMPFERARTLLAYGQLQRRRKDRRASPVALTEALDIFETLGAALWAERARGELARTAARRASDDLTSTEQLIARLAAEGVTNKSIAERVFLSQKTVEANLARAYRKLGITSRAQLARALDAREPS